MEALAAVAAFGLSGEDPFREGRKTQGVALGWYARVEK
jgi:hypothetical protein